MPPLALPLTVLALLLSAAPPVAEMVRKDQEEMTTLRVIGDRLEGDVLSLRFSSLLTLRLTVEGKEGFEVDAVSADANEKNWNLVSESRSRVSEPAPGKRSWEKEFVFDPRKTGDVEVPTVSLRRREGPDAAWKKVEFKSITVKVVGPEDADVKDLRGDLPIETLPPVHPWYRHLPLAGAILLAVALLALLVTVCLRRVRTPTPVPPHERALRELEVLASTPGVGHSPDWYHTQISSVVRRYLEERFSMPASRQTTEEFFESVRRGEHLNAEQQQFLRDLLVCCDLAKFTGLPPSPEECAEAVALARAFIMQTAPVE
ncbi:MAG: hypothetical protein HYS12_23320 [Planctomycetes bacterium]|nr:hypothetical protein [Planctomycetota bacterium]